MHAAYYDVVFYSMHTCAPSIMSPRVEPPVDLLGEDLSPFFARNLQRDFQKTLFEELSQVDFDVLLCDFVEERYDLIRTGGGLISDSWALSLSPAHARLRAESELVDRASLPPDAFAPEVRAMAARLADIAGARPLLLNHVALAETYVRGGRIEHFPEGWVGPINKRLAAYGEAFRSGAPDATILDTTRCGFRADYAHRWRCEPFHYEPAFYRRVIDELTAALYPEAPVRIMSSYERWWPGHAARLTWQFESTYRAFNAGDHKANCEALAERARTRPLTADEAHYYGRSLQAVGAPAILALHLLTLAAEGGCSEERWVQVFLARSLLDLGVWADALKALRAAVELGGGDASVTAHVQQELRRIISAPSAPDDAREAAALMQVEERA